SAIHVTHAAIWYLLDSKTLLERIYSLIGKAAGNGTPTYISAITLVEVVYLVERGRIIASAFDRFSTELNRQNLAFTIVPVDFQVANLLMSAPRSIVPDMPDRIIAAQHSTSACHLLLATGATKPAVFKQFGRYPALDSTPRFATILPS